MNHPLNLEIHADAHRSDLLAEARNVQMARSAGGEREPASEGGLQPRLRYGLATTIVATSLALAAAVAGIV